MKTPTSPDDLVVDTLDLLLDLPVGTLVKDYTGVIWMVTALNPELRNDMGTIGGQFLPRIAFEEYLPVEIVHYPLPGGASLLSALLDTTSTVDTRGLVVRKFSVDVETSGWHRIDHGFGTDDYIVSVHHVDDAHWRSWHEKTENVAWVSTQGPARIVVAG